MPSSSALPQKSLRASSQAIAMPNGSATSVATTAMRSDSCDRGPFVGGEVKHAATCAAGCAPRHDVGLIRNVKPYVSNIALRAPAIAGMSR